MKNFLSIYDCSASQLEALLQLSSELKKLLTENQEREL